MPRGVRNAVHQSRASETRDMEAVHEDEDTPWIRGATLRMPPARPGMDQRWIVFAIHGSPTPANYARKLNEGWVPRKADSLPSSWHAPTVQHGNFAGCVVVEGSVLCERPLTMSARRERHFRKETLRRTEATNADLQRVNAENRNPAFGPIGIAIGDRKVLREVNVAPDSEE